MTRLIAKVARKESGQVLVLAALSLVVLIGFTGLTVDVGMAQYTRSKMQNAADAAALAGASELPTAGTAIITATDYAASNGAPDWIITATTPYAGDPNKIEVVCAGESESFFTKVLGIEIGNVGARAVAERASMQGGPFDYTVFSGDPNYTLTFNGSNTTVRGSAHSNDDFTINGSSQEITGSAEAVSKFTMNGSNQTIVGTCQAEQITTNGSNIHIGAQLESAAAWIDMPDFSELIQTEAESAGQAYLGNRTFNGSNHSVDSPIYVDGNLTVNGSGFSGKGIVLVSGNITFNGSNLSSSGSSVCFYSKNGNITINGSHVELDGLVYAPNGTITMNGSHQTVNGRVIGNRVVFNGSTYDIASGAGDLDCLPRSGVKLIE